ncbi:D-aminoacyl-tRNA deacylase [Saccharibacillus sp. CPCC 101409]|uniref:D-aminoacyl-tRNA deacylase n=1 Tax=Saccharibacillus sp. CPCC 101409 TaxID=3058041 RepID=UPI002672425E|nr:D-aminoacyl-tRNA deacylase [Saccharibacillus sp. CPCC 101409]MDO3409013.1 D-aminoacyl-tRNA deacylase [Saccharibacillus sp. CPCC 101409]
MKLVIQRCKQASVSVDGSVVGRIDEGLVILVGVTQSDTEKDALYLADKAAGLRIFEDEAGKMNRSVEDIGGKVLSVSQFTLYGDTRKGRRPSFTAAARPEPALALYEAFNKALRARGLTVETGVFGAMMDVSLVNWGPVTLIVESGE